jgi:enoyl-CoA hydratase/carnithine racemase
VLTGSGTRAFCAGSDIKEMGRTGQMADTETLLNAMPNAGHVINKPIIAAVTAAPTVRKVCERNTRNGPKKFS